MINNLIHIFFHQFIVVVIFVSLATAQASKQIFAMENEKLGSSNIASVSLLPDEVLTSNVFTNLELNDLGCAPQVCTRWKNLSEDPIVWESWVQKSPIKGDYSLFMNWDKDKVAVHFLRVKINAMSEKTAIEDTFKCFPIILRTPHPSLRIFIDPILEECTAYKSRLSLLRESERVVGMIEGHTNEDSDKLFTYA